LTVTLACLLIAGCASQPTVPWTADFELLEALPPRLGEVRDDRGRFREIFCTVLEEHGKDMPDYRSCEEALTRVGTEPPGSGQPVDLGASLGNYLVGIVPGFGWDCITGWLKFDNYGPKYLGQFGYDAFLIDVDGLSGTKNNAAQIAEALRALPPEQAGKDLILAGYSKGAPDILEFITGYPELARNVVAVVAMAGAVSGSPLALDSTQDQANLLTKVPRSDCDEGDGLGVESLRPDVRQAWLAEHPLPDHIRYYSVLTYPEPDRMSTGLKSSWKKLGETDIRNDSQVIFYDEVIPGSTVIALPNADHWAMAVPVSRAHSFAATTFVDENDYPREVFLEALMRYIEEDLEQ